MIRGREESIFDFLKNINGQLFVPIYQRDYSWTMADREYFWKFMDNIDLKDNYSKHYLHSILTKEHGNQYVGSDTGKISIIDGQQRIITSSLLFAAICAFCKNNENITFDWENQIYNKVLIRPGETGKDKFRLLTKDSNEEVFEMIIEDLPIKLSKNVGSSAIVETYRFFLMKLTIDNVEEIFYKFCRFVIGNDVAEDHDNPQILFETINFSGTPLKEFEMVRCYTLMNYSKEEQERIYYKYWADLTNRFNKSELTELFKSYSYYYYKNLSKRIDTVDIIKAYEKDNKSKIDFLKDISKFADKFEKITSCKTGIDEIDKSLQLIIQNKITIPFLINLYDIYLDERMELNEFISCIKLLESFIVRLKIVDSSTAGTKVNHTLHSFNFDRNAFEELSKMICRLKDHKGKPRNIISDSVIINKILASDFYKEFNSKFVKLFLTRLELENNYKKELNLSKYSIEHIMPQELTEEWMDYLGRDYEIIHATYCHTLGNLTLTAYNQNLSNKLFEEKRTMPKGFCEDKLSLNEDLSNIHHWNQDTILERTNKLAQKAVEIFTYPEYDETKRSNYQKALMSGK